MKPKCAKCRKPIKDDDRVMHVWGKEYHWDCCPHRKIKRIYPFGRKSKARMECEVCSQVIKGKDLAEIRKRKELEQKKHKEKPEDEEWKKVTKEALKDE